MGDDHPSKRPRPDSTHDASASMSDPLADSNNVSTCMTKSSRTAFELPSEVLHQILDYLILDLVEHSATRVKCSRVYSHSGCSLVDCRIACLLWLTTQLPAVHSFFLRHMAPVLLPCLAFPSYSYRHKVDHERLAFMCSPTFAPVLGHLKHLRIDFDSHSEKSRFFTDGVAPSLWLAHIYSICIHATRLESLEWSDLVLNAGDMDAYDMGYVPYGTFEGAKPLPFDLTCSQLLSILPQVDDNDSTTVTNTDTDAAQALLYAWGQDAVIQLVQQLRRAASEVALPQLKHVLITDGNGGISVDDYANLFLIDRLSLSDAGSASGPGSNCETWGHPVCTRTTACPSLSSLTLVLWYQVLQINAAFLHAMLHVRQHHPHLKHLTLISRRLRYEPRIVGTKVSLQDWFRYDVVPVLQLAQRLLAPHLSLTIYILSTSSQRYKLSSAVQDYWPPLSTNDDNSHNFKVEIMEMYDFKSSQVFEIAAKEHRTRARMQLIRDSCEAFDQGGANAALASLQKDRSLRFLRAD